jgi:hypothetical protein
MNADGKVTVDDIITRRGDLSIDGLIDANEQAVAPMGRGLQFTP